MGIVGDDYIRSRSHPTVGGTKEGIIANLLNNLSYRYDICWLHGNVVNVRMTVSTSDMVVNFVQIAGVTHENQFLTANTTAGRARGGSGSTALFSW